MEYLPFDFANHPARYIVLNLGTNDASQIYFRPDKKTGGNRFQGELPCLCFHNTAIEWTKGKHHLPLGCMDYYLFDTVKALYPG